MTLSLAKIRHLVMIAECGSLSAAAAALNISQPALSRSIASVEALYGVRIFDRIRTGVTPTSSGVQILGEVERFLRSSRVLDHNLRLYGRGETGEVRVGIGPLISGILLSELARRIFADRPRVRMRALVRPTDVLVQALLDDEIELMIAPGPFDFPQEIERESIGARVSAAFIVRPLHPLLMAGAVGLEDVLRYPLACSVEIPWAQREGATGGAFICDNYEIIRDVVPATDLVWVCPQYYVEDQLAEGTFAVLDVADSPLTNGDSPFAVNDVVVGRLMGRTPSPIAQEIIRFCHSFFQERPHIR